MYTYILMTYFGSHISHNYKISSISWFSNREILGFDRTLLCSIQQPQTKQAQKTGHLTVTLEQHHLYLSIKRISNDLPLSYHHTEYLTAQFLSSLALQKIVVLQPLPYYLQLIIYYIFVVCLKTSERWRSYLFIIQWALFAAEKSETLNCLAHLPVKYT